VLKTAKEFSKTIEILSEEHALSLIDTITWYAEKNEIEMESVVKMLTPNIKEKIYYEASKLRCVKKKPELPL